MSVFLKEKFRLNLPTCRNRTGLRVFIKDIYSSVLTIYTYSLASVDSSVFVRPGVAPGVCFSARAPRRSVRKTLPRLRSPGCPHPYLEPRCLPPKDRLHERRHRHQTLLAGPCCSGARR